MIIIGADYHPGLTADLSKVAMRFSYEAAFGKSSPKRLRAAASRRHVGRRDSFLASRRG
jgi:hypothetical protein